MPHGKYSNGDRKKMSNTKPRMSKYDKKLKEQGKEKAKENIARMMGRKNNNRSKKANQIKKHSRKPKI